MDKSEFKYLIALVALMITASLHNLAKSIILFFTQRDNKKTAWAIKIIVNIFGIALGTSYFGIILVIDGSTPNDCLMATYTNRVANLVFSGSISLFLVWKLRQFKSFDIILYGFLIAKTIIYIVYLVISQPQNDYSSHCDIGLTNWRIILLIMTVIDLLGDSYFTFHFIQFIRRNLKLAQNNEQHVPLSRSLIIWNTLRILMIMAQHMNPIAFNVLKAPTVSFTIQAVVFIILSYVITFDVGNSDSNMNPVTPKDIENLEAGKRNRKNLQITIPKVKNGVTIEPTRPEDVVLKASNGMLVDVPLNDVYDDIQLKQKDNLEMLFDNGDIGLAKPLTFYELASMILGKSKKNKEQPR